MLMVSEHDRDGRSPIRQVADAPLLEIQDVGLSVRGQVLLQHVTFTAGSTGITTVVGPSGSGKSSLLRICNRMWDYVPGARVQGRVSFHGQDIYGPKVDLSWLRTRIGMVFQRPTPSPRSIFDKLALPLRVHGIRRGIAERVEAVLSSAGLWDEVKDRLTMSALTLSGGQQQRLSIARALALNPEVLLMDEPQSALDPRSRETIRQLIESLGQSRTIILVTHHLEEAERLSDQVLLMMAGQMEIFGPASDVFGSEMMRQLATVDR